MSKIQNKMFRWTPKGSGEGRVFRLGKVRRMVEHEEWERERRDRGCLEDLNVGETFTDTSGNHWERTE